MDNIISNPRFCPHCGKQVATNDTFCRNCRRNLPLTIYNNQQNHNTKIETEKVSSPYIRNKYIAFILGTLGGIGQLYNGEVWYTFFIVNFGFGLLTFFIHTGLKAINPNLAVIAFIVWLINGYICYIDAQKINSGNKGFLRKSRLFYPLLVLTIIIQLIAFGAGYSELHNQQTITTYNVTTYNVVQSVKYNVVQAVTTNNLGTGYSQYNSTDLYFSVYLPKDWDSYIIDSKASSAISSDQTLSASMMPKIVYFFNKNIDVTQSVIMVMGMDLSKGAWGDTSTQSMNDGFIEGLKQGIEKSQARNIVVKSKGENYLINGYEARVNVITYTTPDGVPSTQKIIIIKNGSKFYAIDYIAIDNMYNNQLNIVDGIVSSFIPIN